MCELANAECVGRATAAAGALTTTLISPTADVSALGSKSSRGGAGGVGLVAIACCGTHGNQLKRN